MRIIQTICFCFFMLLLCHCGTKTSNDMQHNNISLGNKLIDAFYSFNHDSLASLLADAKKSQPDILYYQKWAECGNYKVLDRAHYFEKNDSTVLFPVTVKDDLMKALQIDFNVTDTFHITFKNGKIIHVENSSNDVAEYYKAKTWVKDNRPELIEKPCEGIWAGGPTPCECILGMIKGFVEYKKR